jgi:hypothetical protein
LAQHGRRGFINCNKGFTKGGLYDSSKKMLPKTELNKRRMCNEKEGVFYIIGGDSSCHVFVLCYC